LCMLVRKVAFTFGFERGQDQCSRVQRDETVIMAEKVDYRSQYRGDK
jgi:hypothetical protein